MLHLIPKFPVGAFPQTPWIRFSVFWQIPIELETSVSYNVAQYYHHFCIKDFLDCSVQFDSFIILPDFDWQKYEGKEKTDY